MIIPLNVATAGDYSWRLEADIMRLSAEVGIGSSRRS
jgi:hypothetical protein